MPLHFDSEKQYERWNRERRKDDRREQKIRDDERAFEFGGPMFREPTKAERVKLEKAAKKKPGFLRRHAARPLKHALRPGHRARARAVGRTLRSARPFG